MNLEKRIIQMMKKLFDDCVYYQSVSWKNPISHLKNTYIWTSFETLCEIMNVDSCWFYEYITGIKCDCNPNTQKHFQGIFDKMKG